MHNHWVLTSLLLTALVLGACATIVEGSDQTVTVITEPPGAVCSFTRAGTTIAVANPTPSTVSLEKSKDNISLLCEKDGYFNGAAALTSEFKAMTFGNIIFGEIIGVGVDAASGAMHEYPESITGASCKIAEGSGFFCLIEALAVGPAHPPLYHVLSLNHHTRAKVEWSRVPARDAI